jgi:hypothetical protein
MVWFLLELKETATNLESAATRNTQAGKLQIAKMNTMILIVDY